MMGHALAPVAAVPIVIWPPPKTAIATDDSLCCNVEVKDTTEHATDDSLCCNVEVKDAMETDTTDAFPDNIASTQTPPKKANPPSLYGVQEAHWLQEADGRQEDRQVFTDGYGTFKEEGRDHRG